MSEAAPTPTRRKVLLLGWDAADWKIISPLIDSGKMPTLCRLVEQGVMGGLSSLSPLISPLLWTSISTGVRADRHAILTDRVPDRATGIFRPIGVGTRASSAVWNYLSEHGLRTHVVNWYATHPPETVNGICISDRFTEHGITDSTVSPKRFEEIFSRLGVHPGELSAEHLLPFIPRLAEIDQDRDRRPTRVAAILAEVASVHAAATWILEHQAWDFLAVHYRGLEQWSQEFLRYASPRLADVSQADADRYGQVVEAGYRFFDMMLARLLTLAGEDATVLIVSDHGVCTGDFRPVGPAAGVPERWHRGGGIFCMRGPGIRADQLIHGTSILDVAPTVLTLFCLPVPNDMEGRPVLAAWTQPPARLLAASTAPPPSDFSAENQTLQADLDAAVRDLEGQGYADGLASMFPALDREAARTREMNLALVYISSGRPAKALPLLEQLNRTTPGQDGILLYLAYCHYSLLDYTRCRHTLATMPTASVDKPLAQLLLAMVDLAEHRPAEALDRLAAAQLTHRRDPQIIGFVGQAYLQLGQHEDARSAFERALEIDSDYAAAHLGLAVCFAQQARWQDAADASLSALAINHFYPEAHFILGVSLAHSGSPRRAIVAFENTIGQRPGHAAAHDWLARIHKQVTGDVEKAMHHRTLAETGRQFQGVS